MKEIVERVSRPTIGANDDLHLILDAVPTPLSWATIRDGRIRFVNRAFTRTFGYREEDLPTVDDWIDQAYPEETDRCRARLRWRELWASCSQGTTEIPPEEVQVRRADGTTVTVQHRGIILHQAGVAIATFEDISARKLAEDALRRIAFEDPLTGLPNRRALQARWAEAAATNPPAMALLIIDLDRFKPVNDRFGHETGDMVLCRVARRLADCATPDFLGRLGGDEFAILVTSADAASRAETICRAIGKAFEETLAIGDEEVAIGATIGISLYPAHGRELPVLMRHADEALYRLKSAGRSGHEWFDLPAMA